MHFLIIGVGSIGERHLRNFLRIDDVRCSIAEVNPRTREAMASQYGAVAAYADYREADLSSFDGVVICVPANLHVPIATEVVQAGTHVLTEKPLAVSLDGIDELKRLRDEKGVVVSVAFTFRSDPLIREMRDMARAGELGTVRVINYYVGQYWPAMRKDYPPQYAQKRETGGGAIPDMLVHTINYLEWMFGPCVEVSAKQWRLELEDITTEDTGFITMRMAGDQIAQLGACMFQRDTNLMFQIMGGTGTLEMTLDAKLGSPKLRIYSAADNQWSPGKAQPYDRDDVFRNQAQHFIDCIEGRDRPRCILEEGEQTLRAVLAALESSDGDGRFVKVQQVGG